MMQYDNIWHYTNYFYLIVKKSRAKITSTICPAGSVSVKLLTSVETLPARETIIYTLETKQPF
jgi:hypothetical protein